MGRHAQRRHSCPSPQPPAGAPLPPTVPADPPHSDQHPSSYFTTTYSLQPRTPPCTCMWPVPNNNHSGVKESSSSIRNNPHYPHMVMVVQHWWEYTQQQCLYLEGASMAVTEGSNREKEYMQYKAVPSACTWRGRVWQRRKKAIRRSSPLTQFCTTTIH